jgi:general secretion pathway protein A
LVNLICDRSLLGAYVQGKDCVDKKTLLKAVREVFGEHDIRIHDRKLLKWPALILLLIVCGAGLAAVYHNREPKLITAQQAVASKPKEAVPAIVQFDSLEWPSTLPVERSKSMAYDALFNVWGLTYQNKSAGTACVQVVAKGLRCLEGKISLDKLIRLNRPAVIRLSDEKGGAYYAALKTITGDSAQCIIGGEPRNVDLQELKKRLHGDYLILWRITPDYKGILYPGDRSPVVAWLENKLAAVQGRNPLDTKNLIYGEMLVNQVMKFQRDEGIPSVGFVGPRTIISLNNKSGSDEPKLMKKAGAQ